MSFLWKWACPIMELLGRFMYHLKVASLKVSDSILHLKGSDAPIRDVCIPTAIRCSKWSIFPPNEGKLGILKFSGTSVSQSSWAKGCDSSTSSSPSSSYSSLVHFRQFVLQSFGFVLLTRSLYPEWRKWTIFVGTRHYCSRVAGKHFVAALRLAANVPAEVIYVNV
jgi:hypothetical protein